MTDTYGYIEQQAREGFETYNIPSYMQQGILNYLIHRIEAGGFLAAVIRNDLSNAVGKADITNIQLLPNYVKFFYNCVPSNAWGSSDNYYNWLKGE